LNFFLVPLAVLIIYHDVRYRRIPNAFVLATLISGLTLNFALGFAGWSNSSAGAVWLLS
jgi:Flp pilus assembly protein protease CpaA